MKKIFYLYSKSLLSKLALVAILVIGGGSSAWAQKALPYSYGFENNNLAGEGWTTVDAQNTGSYKTGIAYSGYTSKTGTYYFRFYSNENPPQYLISPLLADSESEIVVSFYYRVAYNNNTESFCVGSTTSSDNSVSNFTNWKSEVSCNSTSYAQCEYTFPAHTRYIAIKSTTETASANMGNNYYLCIDDINIEINNPYKTPTNFALDSFTENSASFSWAAGNSETAWQLAYSSSSTFTPGTDGTTLDITTSDLEDSKYTLTGLTEGTTYYAAIRANYGSDNYSEWTEKISFVPRAETETVINSSTSTNGYVPFYASSAANLLRSQFIIPSTSLTTISGRQITKLTFRSSTATADFGAAKFEVFLKEVSNSTYSTNLTENWGVKVFNSASLSVVSNNMEIEFDTPYNYNGGNLQIGIKQTVKGTGKYLSWYAVSSGGYTCRYHNDGESSGNYVSYLPEVTIMSTTIKNAPIQIDLNGYTTFASPYPLDLTTANLPLGLKAYKAAVDAENSKVLFTEIDQAVPANTGILLEGAAGETYAIPVAASGTTPEGNAFLVNSTGGTFEAESGYTYYGMKKATSAEDPIVFATFAPATVAIPTNKAYLKVANTPSGLSRQLVCAFSDNTTTAIAEIANRQNGQNSYFNLAGQRVDGSRFAINGSGLKPGLYIINGKKMVIK